MRNRSSVLALGLVLAASAALRAVLAFRTVPVDDAFITLRYARNLGLGHGLVYQAGAQVFALCGPLYAALLAPAFRAGANVVPLLPYAGILFDLASIWMVYRLAARAAGVHAGLLAAAFCGFFPWQALACGYGMETQLFQFLVFGAFAAAAEDRWTLSATAAGFATLTRPEGLVASLLIAIVYYVTRTAERSRSHRAFLRALSAWGLCVLPWAMWAWAIYGSPVPTSIVAKSRSHVSVAGAIDYFFTGNPLLLLLWLGAVVGVIVVFRQKLAERNVLRSVRPAEPSSSGELIGPLLCGLWAMTYTSLFLAGRPSFLGPWYRPPVQGALAVLAAFGLARLSDRAGRRVARPALLLALCTFAWTGLCALAVPRVLATAKLQRSMADLIYRPMSLWARDHSAPADTIMAGDIGYIGYFSDRPVLDLGGLVTPSLLRALLAHPAAGKTGVPLVLARRPLIFLAPDRPPDRAEFDEPSFVAAYRQVASFPPEEVPAPTDGLKSWRVHAYLRRGAEDSSATPGP